MSDRPTPETDAYCLRAIGFPTGYEWREFARNLERQRDEARDQLTRICREGFGYQDTISLEPCADYTLRKLKEEREELLRLRVENDHNWQAVADLEKIIELAREQIAKANSERENDTQSELAAWELLKQTRELARELRDALEKIAHETGKQWQATQPLPDIATIEKIAVAACDKAKEVLP